jgi:SPP1 family predicted phage head-tail adaptor
MIDAGALRDRVGWQRASDVADGAGGYTRSWAAVRPLWAKVTPTGGKEGLVAGTLLASQNWRVEIRWRPDRPTTGDRFVHNGRALNILSIEDPTGTRETLVALCSTDSAQ